ncbi:MAG: acyl-CoA dehydrogenase family protein [Acidobacteria bacterium]|nr:acyl-CoA dehydrogenase family protein [Acidobacteriota bacterium]
MTTSTTARKGGAWLVDSTDPAEVFTPEKLSEEHRLIARTAAEFVAQEVLPQLDRLEQKDWALARDLLRRCGELGLLGADVPEAYGGVGLDKAASVVVNEMISRSASFGATFGGQTNLAVLPILMFGTDAQRRKYIPGLLAGELVGAYALSESGSGSDALGAKARAARLPDGSFALNGEKMWITNGGFADLFIVFAKLDGEQFTAFIVERAFPGVSTGREEHKMGLHGSSTTPLILQEAHVPAENLLGEIGKGHKVAFNVLNFGRFKLGASCSGSAKAAIGESVKYATQRKQFGQAIAGFGAIKHKIGEMIARTYALESLIYRTAGLIDATLEATRRDPTDGAAVLAALEEFAVEASIAKVFGSETVDFVLDENVQIHGGNGYVRDYPAERRYRDARVNRIFEGTNEINRLLIPTMLVRRALKGGLPIVAEAKKVHNEARAATSSAASGEHREQRAIGSLKKVALLVLGVAMERYGERLGDEQEILTLVADITIDVYAAESALLRALDASRRAVPTGEMQFDAARVFLAGATVRAESTAREALSAMLQGEPLQSLSHAVRRFLDVAPINTIAIRRCLAEAATAKGGYLFQ